MITLSLDSEATGLDLFHGARPFLVTFGLEDGTNVWYEWKVDPLTRKVRAKRGDLLEINERLEEADILVLQNAKFDFQGLSLLFQDYGLKLQWDWSKVRDTLLAGHLLASNQPHDLTSMVLVYCHADIQPFEDRVKESTKAAIKLAKSLHPHWRLAKKGLREMPSAKESTWKYDMWLPRQLALELKYEEGHRWYIDCSDYANGDSTSTLALWKVQGEKIRKKEMWKIYEERLKVLPVACSMEARGVTVNRDRLDELTVVYKADSGRAAEACLSVAKSCGYDLVLPKGANNNSLKRFVFDVLKLPAVGKTDSGEPSLDKDAIAQYEATLPEESKGYKFLTTLRAKRKKDTSLSYMEGYRRYWIPLGIFNDRGEQLWYLLHPSLNPTGADTLRWSSSNPNEQNVSKIPDEQGRTLRSAFGPAPGREWWSADAQNIELRIPAFEANEREMVRLFRHPEEPPYFGSYHLLVFDTLHPEKFAKHGKACKDVYAATWYSRSAGRPPCGDTKDA